MKHSYQALFILMLPAVLMLTSCQGEGSNGPVATDKPQSEAVIRMMLVQNTGEPPLPGIVPELEQKTGKRLGITWVPENLYSDQMVSALANGILPEVLSVKAVDLRHSSVVNAVRSGGFWEIGPYLSRFPLLTRYLDPSILHNGSYFGRVYGLYWERPVSRQGIQYRKDWLDRLGLAEPRTVDDLYQVLRAFTFDDPDGNGKQDTYGLVDRNDLVYGAFRNLAVYLGAPNGWALQEEGLLPDFYTDAYMDAMKFMKKLYNEGVMNSDFTVTSKLQQEERFVRGEAGMMITNILASGNQDKMAKLNPKAVIGVQNRVSGPQGDRVWGGPGFGGLFLFPKSSVKTEKELLGILDFFEKTLSADVHNLLSFGIPDKHYTLLGSGSVKIWPDTKSMREREVEPYTTALRLVEIPYLVQDKQSVSQQQINAMTADNKTIAVADPSTALVSQMQAERGNELGEMITNATYMYILGQVDDAGFMRERERWEAAGGAEVIREMNESYRESERHKQ
ncbi:MAG: transporter substrate-binding protein [Paenibacillaceae bacterium]|nr:transporter substrate-binding protein [Paenibacillaceae bacterium]